MCLKLSSYGAIYLILVNYILQKNLDISTPRKYDEKASSIFIFVLLYDMIKFTWNILPNQIVLQQFYQRESTMK